MLYYQLQLIQFWHLILQSIEYLLYLSLLIHLTLSPFFALYAKCELFLILTFIPNEPLLTLLTFQLHLKDPPPLFHPLKIIFYSFIQDYQPYAILVYLQFIQYQQPSNQFHLILNTIMIYCQAQLKIIIVHPFFLNHSILNRQIIMLYSI